MITAKDDCPRSANEADSAVRLKMVRACHTNSIYWIFIFCFASGFISLILVLCKLLGMFNNQVYAKKKARFGLKRSRPSSVQGLSKGFVTLFDSGLISLLVLDSQNFF